MTEDQLSAFVTSQIRIVAREVATRWGCVPRIAALVATEMLLCFELGYLLGEPEHRFGYAIKKDGCLAVTLWYTVNTSGVYYQGNKLSL